ncbi:MAG: 5'/3'-nucleotidase SurE [Acidobacteria bacterium]|nr:5'/3'-nucleotidase SurE [Acidobacteriota bacterium]MBI3655232.1 5'/3'-nucleotidase SurE [Acidobacteriota bacterium]
MILLTNDDGVQATGLQTLREALRGIADTVVVAPDRERSAASHGITLHHPLRLVEIEAGVHSLNGTPADCIIIALSKLFKKNKPDLILSGINHGGNMGDDVLYSGTVAGAREGAVHCIPSIAVSLVLSRNRNNDFAGAARFTTLLVRQVLEKKLPPTVFLSVNIPGAGYKGIHVTKQGSKLAENVIMENVDPRGRKYYWIGQEKIHWEEDPDSDYTAVSDGLISITPLHTNQTQFHARKLLRRFKQNLETDLGMNGLSPVVGRLKR